MTKKVPRMNLTIITSLSVSLLKKLHTDNGVTFPRISLTYNEKKIINCKEFWFFCKLTELKTPNSMKVVKILAASSQPTDIKLLTTVSVIA